MTEQEQLTKTFNEMGSLQKQVFSMNEGAAKVTLLCALITLQLYGNKELFEKFEKTVDVYMEAYNSAKNEKDERPN